MPSTSETNPEGYVVSKIASDCTRCRALLSSSSSTQQVICTLEDCKFLCIHMYACDALCYDFNNGHLCKHIYRVHSLAGPANISQEDYYSEEEFDVDILSCAEACKPPSQGKLYMSIYS